MLPPVENEIDPEAHPSTSALLQLVPPKPVYQLPRAAAVSNPAPVIKSRLDCGVQHLPLLQACPDTEQPWPHAPQLAGSLLRFVQVPLQSVPEEQSQWVPALLHCLPVAQVLGQVLPHELSPPHLPVQIGEHPHVFDVPPPPHVCGGVQLLFDEH